MKKGYINIFLILAVLAVILVSGYWVMAKKDVAGDLNNGENGDDISNTATTSDTNSDNSNNDDTDDNDPAPVTSFKSCSADKVWKCQAVTQGAAPDPQNPAPTVCGCAPVSCTAGQALVVSAAEGKWPDGSLKGSFNCSANMPPSSNQ